GVAAVGDHRLLRGPDDVFDFLRRSGHVTTAGPSGLGLLRRGGGCGWGPGDDKFKGRHRRLGGGLQWAGGSSNSTYTKGIAITASWSGNGCWNRRIRSASGSVRRDQSRRAGSTRSVS